MGWGGGGVGAEGKQSHFPPRLPLWTGCLWYGARWSSLMNNTRHLSNSLSLTLFQTKRCDLNYHRKKGCVFSSSQWLEVMENWQSGGEKVGTRNLSVFFKCFIVTFKLEPSSSHIVVLRSVDFRPFENDTSLIFSSIRKKVPLKSVTQKIHL